MILFTGLDFIALYESKFHEKTQGIRMYEGLMGPAIKILQQRASLNNADIHF